MATKIISMTEKAYKALLREKKSNESFTETILRITKKSGKLSDCFGTWKMTNEEEKTIFNRLVGHGSAGRNDSRINREIRNSNSKRRLSVSLQYIPKKLCGGFTSE